MLVDFKKATGKTYDVCIIGAGPAGIITALELCRSDSQIQVCILDFGPSDGCAPPDNALDETIQVDNLINHHPAHECTNKGIGGSTASWGGRCVMYDEVDFVPRKIIGEHCTWTADLFHQITQFIPETQAYFESGRQPFFLSSDADPIAEDFVSSDVVDTPLERWSLPTRFGDHYRNELISTSNLEMVCGVRATAFSPTSDSEECSTLNVQQSPSGEEASIRARVFVVACGAQESTRILLNSPALFRAIGGPPTSLGKFYQGHVSGKIASVVFSGDPKKTEYGFRKESDGTFVRRRFQLTKDCILREDLLNTALWLDNPLYFDAVHRSGAMSFMYLAMITPILGKKLAPPAIAYSITKGKVTQIWSHLGNVVRGLPQSVIIPAQIFWKRYFVERKLPGVFLYSPKNEYALHYHAEQVPRPENRMELGLDGQTLEIHYSLSDDDADSIVRTHEILDQSLRASGSGRLRYWYEKEDLHQKVKQISRDGLHQNGTTRIAAGPDRGVVDSDLLVFGTSNVFVCSSSVFPTSGQANPTFMLGAFAVRLAKHLREHSFASS